MYEQFFGLTEKPFSIQPDPSFLYWGRTHRLAYAMLEYGVLNHAGISVITGEVGCGKTTLVHRLLDQLSDSHTVALLSNVQEGRGDLLSWVLMAFGQPFTDTSHVALFSQLQSFFIGEYSQGKRIVMIIDEAQNLSMDMLEELRLLSNINAGKDQLLQLILVGQPELKDILNSPRLLQLTQRVGSDFHLTPLSREEVHAYIETRLSIAGSKRRIFTQRAIDLVAEQSRGVPRVINVIADTALVYAFSAEDLVVGVETVRNVIRDKKAYGVFGIASDEKTAAPIAPAEEGGLDAFVDEEPMSSGEEAAEDRSGDTPTPTAQYDDQDGDQGFETPAPIPVKTLADVKASVQPNAQQDGQPARQPDAPAHQAPAMAPAAAPIAIEATEPAMRSENPYIEASAETGVVIVGVDPRISPEAAIRSAGDGRAIVFVAIGAMPEMVTAARKAGAVIVDNAGGRPLSTAGRARNAGYRQLKKIAPHSRYVQFVDSDCALDPDWIGSAERFMERRPEVAVIEGRLAGREGTRNEFPTLATQQNLEAPGEVEMVAGGAAFIRTAAFEAAGGYRGDLLACENDDLCIRQRRRGAHIWRLDADMVLTEPRRPTIGSWWSRSRLRGFDNAYAMSLHGNPPERHGVGQTVSAVIWGGVMPALILIATGLGALAASTLAPLTPALFIIVGTFGAGLGIYGLKILASIVRRGLFRPSSWRRGFYAVLGRFPEFLGVMRFWFGRTRPVAKP